MVETNNEKSNHNEVEISQSKLIDDDDSELI